MYLETGDRVQVNLAPFIGAAARCRDSILCIVVAVDDQQVQVRTEPPCRELVLWVARFVGRRPGEDEASGSPFRRRGRSPPSNAW